MAKITIQDEEGQYLNRYEMTPVEGQTNTFDLVRKAAITKQGTPFNADTMGHYVQTEDLKAHVDNEEVHIRPGERDAWNGGLIITAIHTKTGITHNLQVDPGAKNLAFQATADISDGDSWTVNSQPVTAVLQNGEVLPGELFKSGCWVTGVRLSDDGTQLFFRAGASTVPSIFGNGSDGDAVISGTVTLPVPVPHQSIIEKHYKSLYINAGAILRAAAHNAGLIIRVQGDCIIHGTIDQSGLSPKTNPQNTYPYPAQLICGDGGNGGSGGWYTYSGGMGGSRMLKRPYGGGYGAAGGGGATVTTEGNNTRRAGDGGNSSGIILGVDTIFVRGQGARIGTTSNQIATSGTYGGGGGGGVDGVGSDPSPSNGGAGGNGAGSNGSDGGGVYGGGGGGAGNYGGGVVLLFVGGNLTIDGSIKCNGLNGGNGGSCGSSAGARGCGGGSGGGGGGGAIYIYYKGSYVNSGVLNVNGGSSGAPGEGYANSASYRGAAGGAGSIGSITVIKHTN